ncbi:WD repeat domain phosphoinositide-interacting protein 4-like isoform X2 [Hyposmocoma kahamanoa]|uniref:WD repeat domain phosphoinositide-interacting protein 4-like isoform X2 n=1 Tax=Hyposmocoma kahamanoa TaxID=1477025 RepID=UPI000E6D833B|nr:WD repeat domain phosphoinositide-interacting protein 4-like isoform X2 [Hyposmocoma kahamanoa]
MARRRSSGITSLGFNQDQGCFTCCLTSGLRVYNIDPLVEKTHYSREDLGEVALCEMVFRSNWLLVVKARRPCSLMLLDDQRRKFCSEVLFKSPIRALCARRDKVAVVLQSSIQVLCLPSLQRVALLRTPTNSRPLCALATEPGALQILAAPAHRKGSLQLLKLFQDVSRAVKGAQSSSPAVVGCHQTELVCLSLSANGAKLATASARGTIIRLWDTVSKQMLHELRRGSDYADVYCINFNPSGSLVCCVSDKGTLHVWSTRGQPTHLAAAALALPSQDIRAMCAFADDNNAVVICDDGTFHKFTFAADRNYHRNDFEYFLQVGDDDEFLQ